MGVCCDRAEKSSLISQSLPLPLNLSPPSFLPFLLARSLPFSPSRFSGRVSVPECSWSNPWQSKPGARVHTHTRTRAHTRAHTCTRAGTHALQFFPPGHGSDLHLPEVDAPAGHFFTCLLRRAEQHRNAGGLLASPQPHAFYRHPCLKCPGWRRLLQDGCSAVVGLPPASLLQSFPRSSGPSSPLPLQGGRLQRLPGCRRRRNCFCEHIPPRRRNAAGVREARGKP